jgi:hypothetical protein
MWVFPVPFAPTRQMREESTRNSMLTFRKFLRDLISIFRIRIWTPQPREFSWADANLAWRPFVHPLSRPFDQQRLSAPNPTFKLRRYRRPGPKQNWYESATSDSGLQFAPKASRIFAEPASTSRRRGGASHGGRLDLVVAVDAVDSVGDRPRDDEQPDDEVAEHAEIVVQGADHSPETAAVGEPELVADQVQGF